MVSGGMRLKKYSLNIVITISIIAMMSVVCIGQAPHIEEYAVTDAVSPYIPSGVVWTENFDDGNLSDWEIFEINWTLPDGTVNWTKDPNDLFSVSGGILRSIGPEWNFAAYNSSIAYGTWSFDVDVQHPDGFNRFGVSFIGEKFGEHWLPADGSSDAYFLCFWFYELGPGGEIRFARNTVSGGTNFLDTYGVSNISGWKRFIVTREPSGQFYVYLNGSVILDVKDSTHTTSERFGIFGMANPAIDNITVSDTIDYDKAPPKWDPPVSNKQIIVGEPFYYDLNATDYSGLDKWWINDTQNFVIDNDGVVANNTQLAAGDYFISVSVNDTLGNTQNGVIKITVNHEPAEEPMIPFEMIVGVIGVSLVVILVLVIWKSRK